MDMYDCIYSAENGIYNARQYLESGEGINRFCDEAHSAIMWAMEAWLRGHGHKPDTRNGWRSIQEQFRQLAPDNIRNPAMSCASKAAMLEYDQRGGFDFKEKPMPFERWKELAFELVVKAEECIVAIEKDIGCSEDELKKLWLYRRYAKD